jgi:hypothetical protein
MSSTIRQGIGEPLSLNRFVFHNRAQMTWPRPVLLTWLYVTGVMLLLGAEVNMVTEVAAVRAHAVPRADQRTNISQGHPPNTAD